MDNSTPQPFKPLNELSSTHSKKTPTSHGQKERDPHRIHPPPDEWHPLTQPITPEHLLRVIPTQRLHLPPKRHRGTLHLQISRAEELRPRKHPLQVPRPPDEIRPVEPHKQPNLLQRHLHAGQERQQISDALLRGQGREVRDGVEGEEPGGAQRAGVERVVHHAGQICHLREDVDEDGTIRQGSGGEIEDVRRAVGFDEPGLQLGVLGEEVVAGVVCVDVRGDEGPHGGDDRGGVFVVGEVRQGGAVGGVYEPVGGEPGGEVVGAEMPGDVLVGGVFPDGDGGAGEGEVLVEVAAGVDEGAGAGVADCEGAVRDFLEGGGAWVSWEVLGKGGILGLLRSRRPRRGC